MLGDHVLEVLGREDQDLWAPEDRDLEALDREGLDREFLDRLYKNVCRYESRRKVTTGYPENGMR